MLQLYKLNNNLIYFSFFFLLIFFVSTSLQAEIKYKSIAAEGYGETPKEALGMALSEAIAMVNGKSIDNESFLTNFEKVGTNDNDSDYYFSREYQSKIIEKTKGLVKNYKVVDKFVGTDGLWTVIIDANIIQFSHSNSKRKRIAVLPFRINKNKFMFDGKTISADRIQRLFSDNLVSNFVQTRKFTVLDREYLSETTGEKSFLLREDTSLDDFAKLGRELFADYIVVGRIEDLGSELKKKKLITSDKTISYSAVVSEINYRIIDVPTKQIKFADSYTFNGGNELDTTNGIQEQKLISYIADEISLKILNAIYPIKVEKILGNVVTLGMGGDLVIKDQVYDLILLGDKITDTYTKEYLGREETIVGEVKITKVSSKLSSGIIIKKNLKTTEGLSKSSFIVRLKKEKKLSKLEEAKKKIELKKKKKNEDDN